MDRTALFYASPTYSQSGGAVPIFSGSRRQRGGSILGAIKSFVLPLLQGVKRQAVQRATSTALNVAKNVASDAFAGKNVVNSLKTHGYRGAKQLGKNVVLDTMRQIQTQASRKRSNATSKKKQPQVKRPRKSNF